VKCCNTAKADVIDVFGCNLSLCGDSSLDAHKVNVGAKEEYFTMLYILQPTICWMGLHTRGEQGNGHSVSTTVTVASSRNSIGK
jgi:hypothetical protein